MAGGTTTDTSTSACITCSGVTVCSAGTFYKASIDSCLVGGTAADTAPAGVCIDCDAGRYSTGPTGACTACESGFYSGAPANDEQTDCIRCDGGDSDEGSTLESNCTPCVPGRASFTTCTSASSDWPACAGCVDCSAGQYQPATGQGSCIACDVGQATAALASVLSSDCVNCDGLGFVVSGPTANDEHADCTDCVVGRWRSGDAIPGVCTACMAGKYLSTAGTEAEDCIDCPGRTAEHYLGTSQPDAGQTSCADCAGNTYQTAAGRTTGLRRPGGDQGGFVTPLSIFLPPSIRF
jgi:hypothetical protein